MLPRDLRSGARRLVDALASHMHAAFMARDRDFRRARQAPTAPDESSPPPSITEATSIANETPSDGSSSR